MNFLEQRLNDGRYIYDTVGGPEWSTAVVAVAGGHESRNVRWQQMRGRWELGERAIDQGELDDLLDFFAAVRGKSIGFRLLVRGDYEVAAHRGRLGLAAQGTGLPDHELYHRRQFGGEVHDRRIHKPAAVTVYRGGVAVTPGVAPGQVSINTTTGMVGFAADATAAITGHTVGAAHGFTTAVDLPLGIGGRIYLSGTGVDRLDGRAHFIVSKTGTGPYTWTIAADTLGLSAAGGAAAAYPQADEALTWAGSFDTPVRFDADQLRYRYMAENPAAERQRLYWLASLPVVEIRP